MTTDRLNGALSSLAFKAPVRCATTGNITLSGLQTVDGIAIAADDRVLVKDQTNGIQNGIYNADTSTWERAPDFDGNLDITEGTVVPVNQGTTNAETWWRVSTTGTLTVGTTSLAFELAVVNSASMVNFLQAGAGAVSTTLQARGRQQRWLWDFLSEQQRSDIANLGTTDCAAAIQAAHDSLPTGGGVINMGPGGFAIGSTLNFSKPITLRGEGTDNQTLTRLFKLSALNGNGIYVTSTHVHLENFAFAGQAGNGGNGITVENTHFVGRNLYIAAMGNDGIRIGKDAGQNSNLWTLENVRSQLNGRYGLYLHDGGGNAGAGLASRCFFDLNVNDGVRLQTAFLNTFVGCTSESNTGFGLNLINPAVDNMWIGGDIEANTAGQITRAAGATRNMIILPHHSWGIGASVYHNADQGINASSETALAFNSERFDTDDIHDPGSNTRLTCKTAGKYLVIGTAGFANATDTTLRSLRIWKNGANHVALSMHAAVNGDTTWMTVSTIVDLVLNDYLELRAFHGSATSPLNVVTYDLASPNFMMIRQN